MGSENFIFITTLVWARFHHLKIDENIFSIEISLVKLFASFYGNVEKKSWSNHTGYLFQASVTSEEAGKFIDLTARSDNHELGQVDIK